MGRWWPRRDPEPVEDRLAWDELFPLEARLRAELDDVLAIDRRQILGRTLAFGGRLRLPPREALDRLRGRLRLQGYTPFLRAEGDVDWVQAVPMGETVERPSVRLPLGLFLATVLTTVFAGALQSGVHPADLLRDPLRLAAGLPFSAALLGILGVHELGHYTVGRRRGVPVSLPYFIPVPPPFLLGTLGAVIRLQGPVRDRRALFDMAVAGPLAGLAVAVPVYVLGLRLSEVKRLPEGGMYVQLGDALLPKLIERLTLGPLPPGHDVLLDPVGLAAWFGFFVTALNLVPAGQLDGGHIVYALFGRRHGLISRVAVALLVGLGLAFGSPNWLVWAVLVALLMGFRHAPTLDDITPLDGRRRLLGAVALVLLLLLLPPVPISVR